MQKRLEGAVSSSRCRDSGGLPGHELGLISVAALHISESLKPRLFSLLSSKGQRALHLGEGHLDRIQDLLVGGLQLLSLTNRSAKLSLSCPRWGGL